MRLTLSLLVLALASPAIAQPPPGYYDDAQGLTGQALRQVLHDIIDDHDEASYSSMWGHFEDADNLGGDTVWDIYSDQPGGTPAYNYQFVTDQCGQYGGEGDCFNREHSFPQSWYGSGTPMKSDFFHVYPTDGYVNGQRSNDPFGEVDLPFWTSTNGSKSGPNVWPGYTGNAFEPIDEYKGDLARSYFYMLTRYMDVSGSWSSPMLSSGDLSWWAINMLLHWHTNDPVSQKELDRNNAIYQIQFNRNPFIDNPNWAEEVWTSTTSVEEQALHGQRVFYASGSLHFESSQNGVVEIFDLGGRLLISEKVGSRNFEVRLNPGIYLVRTEKGPGTAKVLVTR